MIQIKTGKTDNDLKFSLIKQGSSNVFNSPNGTVTIKLV